MGFSSGFWQTQMLEDSRKSDAFIDENIKNSTLYFGFYIYGVFKYRFAMAMNICIASVVFSLGIFLIKGKTDYFDSRLYNFGVIVVIAIIIMIGLFLPIDGWPIFGLVGYILFLVNKLLKSN